MEKLHVRFNLTGVKGHAFNQMVTWFDVKTYANKLISPLNSQWYFQYKDEDGDLISGSNECEWQSVVSLSKKKKNFIMDVYQVKKENIVDGYVYVSSNCCSDKACVNRKENISYTPKCDPTTGCCPDTFYTRPIPYQEEDDGIIPVKIINPRLNEHKYSGDALRAVALPLGAIGGGCIAIAGDGGLRQWQISNKVAHNAQVPDSFFAIKIGSEAAVLQSNTWYDQTGFKPAPIVTDHVVPTQSIELLQQVPGVKTVEITAKYPVVEVDYSDPKLTDVKIHLEAWNPKIPLNSPASAIPVVIFDFHVSNTSKEAVEVSLLGSLQNIAGWDGHADITDEVKYVGYGGNTNSLYTDGSTYGIDMSNPSLPGNHAFNGHVTISAFTQPSDKMSTMLQYTNVKSLWDAFMKDNLPGQGEVGVSAAGSTFNGAVNTTRTIAAGQTSVFTYVLGWHFPNRYRDWTVGVDIPQTQIFVGTFYSKMWKNIQDVLTYTKTNIDSYRTLTYKFRDAMFVSTSPWQLVDSAAGRISVLNSPSCMWHADGNFYAFEGCSTNSGCCPLNCTHVLNYEMTLAMLYPDLERTMREIDLLHQITPYGVIPSRTPCPLELKRLWSTWKHYSTSPTSTVICVDGEIGTVLKTYREIRHGASKEWFDNIWEPVKLVMHHWLDVLDEKKNGLIYGPQPNTYDRATYGYMTLIGCLYLCALRAAEEMAKLQGDTEFEKICHDRFTLGSMNLDKECFTNNKWYTQVIDPEHETELLGDATFVGALYGQWWAHVLNLGYLLPRDHIRSHLYYTYTRNYVASFDPASQAPRRFCDQRDNGWVQAVWDKKPKNILLYSTEVAWSGIIYPFAGLCLYEGLKTEGLDVLEKTRSMYDGTRRSPWNEIECGDHYTRPMSASALFMLASGQTWSFHDYENEIINLGFNPTINASHFTGFFILGKCWGTFTQLDNDENKSATLNIEYGQLRLNTFTLNVYADKANAMVGPRNLSFTVRKVGEMFSLNFIEPLLLEQNDRLLITFR